MNQILVAIQAGLFYLIPYIIGSGVRALIEKLKHEDSKQKEDTLLSLGENFALGTACLFALALFVRYVLGSLVNIGFEKVYFPLVWILTGGGVLMALLAKKLPKFHFKLSSLGILGLIVSLSAVVYSLWYFKSPYSLNWDYYQHQGLSRAIQQGEFDFFTTKISDTFGFDSYPPTFHLLVSASQFPAKLTPNYILGYWNIIGFYHLLTVGLASYVLGMAVTRRPQIAALSAIVGTITFDSISSFTNLFLLPQNVAATLFVFALSSVIARGREGEKPSLWLVAPAVVSLVLMHYIVGILAALILLFAYVFVSFKDQVKTFFVAFPFVSLMVLAVVLGILGSNLIDLTSINQGEASLYLFDLGQKVEFAQRIYGNSLLIFAPLGIAYAISRRKWRYSLALLLLFGFGGILVSSFPYVVKFYVLARFIVHLFIAMGIWSLLKYVRLAPFRLLGYLAAVAGFTVLLAFNVVFWKSWIGYKNQFTHISRWDIEASDFLVKSYGDKEGVVLISDPATQMIFEGLGGVDSVGGGFMTTVNRTNLYEAITAQSPAGAKNDLDSIQDRLVTSPKVRLLALSGRSFAWKDFGPDFRYRFDSNVWAPEDLSYWDIQKLTQLENSGEGFKAVYKSDYVWIFELE